MPLAAYRRNIRAAVRGLWAGILTRAQAKQTFELAIENDLVIAWNEGAAKCDISPDELTQDELAARDDFIENQLERLPKFLDAIAANTKADGGKLTPQFKRAELWVNQYSSVVEKAQAMACGDEKRIWVLGKVEKHCKTCLRLAGKVKRLSFWNAHVLPRNAPNARLECGGWNCDCKLEKTRKPISRGPLPRLP